MFENFWGNPQVTSALERMMAQERLAQTLLFAGPEGVGKATLARRFGARAGCLGGMSGRGVRSGCLPYLLLSRAPH